VKATWNDIRLKGGLAWEAGEYAKYGEALLIACPSCGGLAFLKMPPFTFDQKTLSIGPASLRFPCGWHGYLTSGNYSQVGDSSCLPGVKKMSNEETKLQKGDAGEVGEAGEIGEAGTNHPDFKESAAVAASSQPAQVPQKGDVGAVGEVGAAGATGSNPLVTHNTGK
jgi:hypothetical protein